MANNKMRQSLMQALEILELLEAANLKLKRIEIDDCGLTYTKINVAVSFFPPSEEHGNTSQQKAQELSQSEN